MELLICYLWSVRCSKHSKGVKSFTEPREQRKWVLHQNIKASEWLYYSGMLGCIMYLCLIEAVWGYSERKSGRKNSRKEAREATQVAWFKRRKMFGYMLVPQVLNCAGTPRGWQKTHRDALEYWFLRKQSIISQKPSKLLRISVLDCIHNPLDDIFFAKLSFQRLKG